MSEKPGRKRREVLEPDADWFQKRIADKGISQRSIARLLNKSASAINKAIHGRRHPDTTDVAHLAAALDVSTDEIMRRFGYKIGRQPIPLVGRILGDGRVSSVLSKRETVALPDTPARCNAFRFDTASTALAAYHGALVVCAAPPADGGVPPDAFGRLCIVEADDHLLPLLGTLQRSEARGAVSLHLFGVADTLRITRLHGASVVVSIHFP